MTVGEKVYKMRMDRNMSLRDFAKLAGVTHTTIARIESDKNGNQDFFIGTFARICENLDYDFQQFLIETGYIQKTIKNADNNIETFDNQQKKDRTLSAVVPQNILSDEESDLIEQFKSLDYEKKAMVKGYISRIAEEQEKRKIDTRKPKNW